MKKRNKYILKNFYQVFSHLLIVLIMSIPVTQLLHHHGNSAIEYAHADERQSFGKALEKCNICEYLSHSHSKEFLLPFVQTPNITSPTYTKICANLIAGNYTFTLQGFTNKGPPTQI